MFLISWEEELHAFMLTTSKQPGIASPIYDLQPITRLKMQGIIQAIKLMTSGKVLVYCEGHLVIFDTTMLLTVSAQDSGLAVDSNGTIIGQFQTLYNVEL